MKIKTLDRQTLRFIREQIDVALAKIATDNGLASLKLDSGSYSDNDFSFRLVGTLDGEAAKEKTSQFAELLGLPADIIGKEVKLQGRMFTITGLDPSKPKNSVSIKRIPDGKRFKCSAAMIKMALTLVNNKTL